VVNTSIHRINQSKTIFVIAEVFQKGKPYRIGSGLSGNIGRFISANISMGNIEQKAQPILGEWCYPSFWQGWRVELPGNESGSMNAISVAENNCLYKLNS
jgi:hypothetical protein